MPGSVRPRVNLDEERGGPSGLCHFLTFLLPADTLSPARKSKRRPTGQNPWLRVRPSEPFSQEGDEELHEWGRDITTRIADRQGDDQAMIGWCPVGAMSGVRVVFLRPRLIRRAGHVTPPGGKVRSGCLYPWTSMLHMASNRSRNAKIGVWNVVLDKCDEDRVSTLASLSQKYELFISRASRCLKRQNILCFL